MNAIPKKGIEIVLISECWLICIPQEKRDVPFCQEQIHITVRNNVAVAIPDKHPVTDSHTLIIPFRHVESFFDLSSYGKELVSF